VKVPPQPVALPARRWSRRPVAGGRPGYDPVMRLVLLHALPFDERMWDSTREAFPDAYVPTLYGLGASVREWAGVVLEACEGDELLVVGNSIGGSCALEMARAAPDQVRGVVLVGAKAGVRRDDRSRDEAVELLRRDGIAAAWRSYWSPLFSAHARSETVSAAERLALEQEVDDLVVGVRAFHDRRDHSRFVRTWRGLLHLVSGAQDRTPTPAAAAASVGGSARALQTTLDHCGHYVPLERSRTLGRLIEHHLHSLGA
jgi:pimeloyl-ACP methyl ester carboxylesterase